MSSVVVVDCTEISPGNEHSADLDGIIPSPVSPIATPFVT